MPCIILRPAHGLDNLISHLGVCHYITKTHLGGQDTLQCCPAVGSRKAANKVVMLGEVSRCTLLRQSKSW
jgi:hypothetical protein